MHKFKSTVQLLYFNDKDEKAALMNVYPSRSMNTNLILVTPSLRFCGIHS